MEGGFFVFKKTSHTHLRESLKRWFSRWPASMPYWVRIWGASFWQKSLCWFFRQRGASIWGSESLAVSWFKNVALTAFVWRRSNGNTSYTWGHWPSALPSPPSFEGEVMETVRSPSVGGSSSRSGLTAFVWRRSNGNLRSWLGRGGRVGLTAFVWRRSNGNETCQPRAIIVYQLLTAFVWRRSNGNDWVANYLCNHNFSPPSFEGEVMETFSEGIRKWLHYSHRLRLKEK